jgi:hypothetical protein
MYDFLLGKNDYPLVFFTVYKKIGYMMGCYTVKPIYMIFDLRNGKYTFERLRNLNLSGNF